MKTIAISIIALLSLTALSSCDQCTECNKYPGKTIELCKKDFASDDSYTAAYHQAIADGYTCD